MKSIILRFILVLVIVALFVAGRAWYYAGIKYQAPPEVSLRLSDIYVPVPPVGGFKEGYETRKGIILLDRAHRNNFTLSELQVLVARLTSRGYKVEPWEKVTDLKEKLRYTDAAVIVAPQRAFADGDGKLLEEFVGKGGRLLLIGESTRPSEINQVATRFGLLFESDYLYNLKENDGNFRNIFIANFRDAEVTRNLKKIALYVAGSITSLDSGIALADVNTLSSVRETKGRLSPVALTADSKVLAIADLTFMAEPYSAVLDNNQFIVNIADWLMSSQRSYNISDFPYFFNDKIGVVYTEASFLDRAVTIKNLLAEQGKTVEVREYQKGLWEDRDLVLLGPLRDVSKAEDFLKAGGITVTVTPVEEKKAPEEEKAKPEPTPAPAKEEPAKPTPTPTPAKEVKEAEQEPEEKPVTIKVEIRNVGQVYQKAGTAILYLYERKGRYVLVVLSDTKDVMKQTIDMLQSGKFRQWLVSDRLGIYHAPEEETKGKAAPTTVKEGARSSLATPELPRGRD